MKNIWRVRASKMYSFAQLVATKPTQTSAAMSTPRPAVWGPVICVRTLRTTAATMEQRNAVMYWNAGLMAAVAMNQSWVRPMPSSQGIMKTENQMASKMNEAMAATAMAGQLSLTVDMGSSWMAALLS